MHTYLMYFRLVSWYHHPHKKWHNHNYAVATIAVPKTVIKKLFTSLMKKQEYYITNGAIKIHEGREHFNFLPLLHRNQQRHPNSPDRKTKKEKLKPVWRILLFRYYPPVNGKNVGRSPGVHTRYPSIRVTRSEIPNALVVHNRSPVGQRYPGNRLMSNSN